MAEKSERAQREESILSFWKERKIFEKSIEKDSPRGEFVFYDGPPFATGLPHYGSLLSSIIKDVIPRYKTMRGFRVRRRWVWDCHGLPIENMVEQELGIKNKKEIEEMGVAKFNAACRNSVLRFLDEWKRFINRIGRFVDYDNSYKTMDNTYIESVWWALKNIHEKGLLYEGRKVLLYCPHCETPLAKAEVAMDHSYKDITEESVYVKFKVKSDDPEWANTSLLAWTTTPWTLPGNVALAVNPDAEFVCVPDPDQSDSWIVLAKDNFAKLLAQSIFPTEYKDLKSPNIDYFDAKDLLGMSYEPLYEIPSVKNTGKRAWYVTSADFVTTGEGTGIVHTAVIYGENDYDLGLSLDLPMVPLLDSSANFNNQAPDFIRGQYFKKAEKAIKEDLEKRSLLFKLEPYTHSYPHCHRCGTALLYNALSSWFINIQQVKERMIKLNEKINWIPEHLKHGRFLNIVENAPDWTISRNRYWASPLPIWKDADGKVYVIGSLDELKKYTKKSGNKYFVMRHGESDNVVKGVFDLTGDPNNHLTENGKGEVIKAANELKKEKIDLVFSSPFLRAHETASLVQKELGLKDDSLIIDERLHEMGPDEDGASARRRVGEFVFDVEERHKNKKILVVSHGMPIWILQRVSTGRRSDDFTRDSQLHTAEWCEMSFSPYPHDQNYELDLHRPYVDDVVLFKDGEEYRRVEEVLDVWFDSGAMPFAQDPQNILYPADFISEAIDQTRGWFYTLHAIGVLMEKGFAYRNVVCLGHLLDKDGKKMSKSVGNVVDPWEEIEKHGVDALRFWMYSVNQPGESKNFDTTAVTETGRKVFNIVDNVYTFYDLYRDRKLEDMDSKLKAGHVLDRWILSRLDELIAFSTSKLDKYKLLEPTRAIEDFVKDLSTWYLRRSRERIKEEDSEARQTLYRVLRNLSRLLAPFAPFTAEDLYQKLRLESDPESVHLEDWPAVGKSSSSDKNIVKDMAETRRIASLALEARSRVDIKVRQPLNELKIRSKELGEEFLSLIAYELNVKRVTVEDNLAAENEVGD